MSLGERIREHRRRVGWSQQQLADRAAVSARTLIRIERGAPAYRTTIRCIALALGVDEKDLTTDETGEAA